MVQQSTLLGVMVMLAVVPIAGCNAAMKTVQIYPGEPRLSAEVAIIEPQGDRVSIAFVDGKRLGPNRSAEILPGKHTVFIELSTRFYFGSGWGGQVYNVAVSFTALAGHAYQAHAEVDDSVWAWMLDSETGALVGGHRPE